MVSASLTENTRYAVFCDLGLGQVHIASPLYRNRMQGRAEKGKVSDGDLFKDLDEADQSQPIESFSESLDQEQ